MTEGRKIPRGDAAPVRHLFPLAAQMLAVLALTLLPVGALAAYALKLVPIRLPYVTDTWLAGSTPLLSYLVPNSLFVFLVAVLLSLVLGALFADFLFIARMGVLLSYVRDLRRRAFKSVPLLPRLGSDEIADIASQLSFATIAYSQVDEQSKGANDRRSIFLTAAAHQLRTPLSELLWAIGDIRSETTKPEDKASLLVSVDDTLKRMRLIVEHLLAGAGVEEGKFGYVFEQKDIVSLIAGIIKDFTPLSERRKITVALEQQGEVSTVFFDTERISLAVNDLLSNAIEYTPAGGSVTVTITQSGETLEICVRDTGIGISEAEHTLLFNKFYRGERARHMHPDGSGLGLYLVKNILERHGSILRIDSIEGKGTAVTFNLHSEKAKLPR